MTKVFTNGVFDLFHEGHYELLKKAKACGDWLVVGIASDESCQKHKRKPFQSWDARAKAIKELSFVDKIMKTPWSIDLDKSFYLDNKIDLHVQGDGGSNFNAAIELGILRLLGRTDNISTTKILQIIKSKNVNILAGGSLNDVVQVNFENELFVLKYGKRKSARKYKIELPDNRTEIEYDSTRAFRKALNDCDFVVKPICIDKDKKILVFQSAPPGAESLFNKFISNEIHYQQVLNIIRDLAMMHSATFGNTQLLDQFGDSMGFLKLKIGIQCRNITRDTALQEKIDRFVDDCLQIKITLLHGDFAPKNILVWADRHLFIDFEESSFADPALELGYFLAHIYIHYFLTNNSQFEKAAQLCLEEYLKNITFNNEGLIARVIKFVGVFVLSRIDGLAYADYIADPGMRDKLRLFGKTAFIDEQIILKKNNLSLKIQYS